MEGWFGLGPVSVLPDQQENGIGSALIKAALNQLKQAGAAGTVVLGEPEYYCHIGSAQIPGAYFPGTPAEYFTVLPFGHETPAGAARYHRAFGYRERFARRISLCVKKVMLQDFKKLAPQRGIEPPTPSLGEKCSIH